jgi:hypothetical protein
MKQHKNGDNAKMEALQQVLSGQSSGNSGQQPMMQGQGSTMPMMSEEDMMRIMMAMMMPKKDMMMG